LETETDLLIVLGTAKSGLHAIALSLLPRRNVEWATSTVEIEVDDLGVYASGCLDVRLHDGAGFSWYLDIRPAAERSLVSLRMERNDAQGGDTLDAVEETASGLEALKSSVLRMVRRVEADVESDSMKAEFGGAT
jgi:hypothetical protein